MVYYIRKRKKREREKEGERYITEREKSEGRCKEGKEFACATYLSIYYIDIT